MATAGCGWSVDQSHVGHSSDRHPVVTGAPRSAVGLALDLAEQLVELAGGDLVADRLQRLLLLGRGVAELGADRLELADEELLGVALLELAGDDRSTCSR